ncbi:MAG: methionyl-tRNA formyltransferase [Endomicrobium sp.]|nr:methionyl-tRNA formyltransferase [Endomicrobium sp.]
MEKKECRKRNKKKEKERQLVRILFFGTAGISAVYLKALHKSSNEIFVVTMPDRPALRGHKLTAPAVKIYSAENNIKFIQPDKFTPEVVEEIRSFDADAGAVVAYGRFIPEILFKLPKYKTFNIHFSLLPKYRGAAPVQYALLNGETETGVTSFYIEKVLDAGSIIIQKKLCIQQTDNSRTLFDKIIPLGIECMNETLELFSSSIISSRPQTGCPSFAPAFKKEEGKIDWNRKVCDIYNQFRGLYIWPGIYSVVSKGKLSGKRIKFINIEIFDADSKNENFGTVVSIERNKGFVVSCSKGSILVLKVQPDSKPVMSAWSFIQGGQLQTGDMF